MAKPFSKIKYTGWVGLDDQLTFGKHIGYTVLEVLKDRPQYIAWLIDNTDIKFYQSVQEQVDKLLPPTLKLSEYPKYMPGYDHDTLSDWSDWHTDVPF